METTERLKLMAPGIHCAAIADLPSAEYVGSGRPGLEASPLFFQCPSYRVWLKSQIDEKKPTRQNLELKRLSWLYKQRGRLWLGYDDESKDVAETIAKTIDWIVKESINLAGNAVPEGARDPDAPFSIGDTIALRCKPDRKMTIIEVSVDIYQDEKGKPYGPQGWRRQHSYKVQGVVDKKKVGYWWHNLVVPCDPIEVDPF